MRTRLEMQAGGNTKNNKGYEKMSLKHFPFYILKFPNIKYWDMQIM